MTTGPSRRPRAEGGRPHSIRVSLSDEELAAVRVAAARDGLAEASWLGDAGVRAARTPVVPAAGWGEVMQQLFMLRAELMEHRRVLRNVGGNLNDVARHANSTGELHVSTTRVQALVGRVVAAVEVVVGQVGELTAAARLEQLRNRS